MSMNNKLPARSGCGMLFSVTGVAVTTCGFLLLCLTATAAHADVWVFEPAIAIDQRFDDNYRIRPQRSSSVNPDTGEVVVDVEHQAKEPVNATRIVGSLGLSKESANTVIKGIARVDGLLTESKTESVSDGLSSNQLLFLDYTFNDVRTTYGIGLDFTQDSPSRDISADITDEGVTASDTGASTTQGTCGQSAALRAESELAIRVLLAAPLWMQTVTSHAG